MPPLIGKPRPNPAARFDTASARNSWFASSRPPCLAVKVRPMAAVSTAPRRKHAKASGTRLLTVWDAVFQLLQSTAPGKPSAGIPCGTLPNSFTPRASKPSQLAARMPPSTTNNATGLFLRKIFPKNQYRQRGAADRQRGGIGFVRCLTKLALFTQKLPCAPWIPNNLGNCVLARKNATPHLNPTITLSEMKLTIRTGFGQPRDEGNERDEQWPSPRQRAEAAGIASARFRLTRPRRAGRWRR